MTYLNGSSSNASKQLREFIVRNSDVFHTIRISMGLQCTGITAEKQERALEDGWTEVAYLADGQEFREVFKPGKGGDYPGHSKYILSDVDDLDRVLSLRYIKPSENQHLEDWLKRVNSEAKDQLASGAFMRLVMYGPIYTLGVFSSPEDLSIWTMDYPDLLLSYLDKMRERLLDYLEYVLDRLDFTPIMNIAGAEYAIPPLMSPKAFDDFVLRHEKPLIDLIHSKNCLVYYHCHGKVREFIPKFIEMGTDGLHPLEPVGVTGDCELREIKAAYGKDICLVGNIQYDDLARRSADEVEEMVRDTVMAAKEGGGFILTPSCTPFHEVLTRQIEENIIRFIQAGIKYGRYED